MRNWPFMRYLRRNFVLEENKLTCNYPCSRVSNVRYDPSFEKVIVDPLGCIMAVHKYGPEAGSALLEE